MPVQVTILKPFVFSRPGGRLAQENRFTPDKDEKGNYAPTVVEIDEEMAAHPWIREHYADGAIESPEQLKARQDAAATKKKKHDEEAEKIRRQSEAAMARARGNAAVRTIDKTKLEAELNTPVNQLKAQRGTDIDDGTNTDKSDAGTKAAGTGEKKS